MKGSSSAGLREAGRENLITRYLQRHFSISVNPKLIQKAYIEYKCSIVPILSIEAIAFDFAVLICARYKSALILESLNSQDI